MTYSEGLYNRLRQQHVAQQRQLCSLGGMYIRDLGVQRGWLYLRDLTRKFRAWETW
jgi:hypothetical protein